MSPVDEYIERAPSDARAPLRRLREAVRRAAPDAVEGISYGMPHYSFPGESGFGSRLCYFGLLKGGQRIAFYTRPDYLAEHVLEATPFMTSKSALQFRLADPLPITLVGKVVRNAVRKHRSARPAPRRGRK